MLYNIFRNATSCFVCGYFSELLNLTRLNYQQITNNICAHINYNAADEQLIIDNNNNNDIFYKKKNLDSKVEKNNDRNETFSFHIMFF